MYNYWKNNHFIFISNDEQEIKILLKDFKQSYLKLGLQIKSQLGKPATLVNSSDATNFTFDVIGTLSHEEIIRINSLRKFADKISLLESLDCKLLFDKMDSKKFKINLQTIDYNFPKIISDILISYHKNDIPKNNNIPFFVDEITTKNEFDYDLSLNSDIYKMMMKKFLVDYALGMRAAEIWKRDYQATGGYLIVRNDGEIICYHFYFTKLFENYLFDNTKLETADPNRRKTGIIYFEDKKMKFKLNLQIRFKK
ncbi:HpaII family restriction endonuclease [Chryseobacterium wangxinyae]|uniref:HpaII family restriction endonuclease n=1 Tax=Chryseobacterium sp. CY353 TaxID=2997334 RepID=UPI0022709127|nr:HpaII family restriction endonuclease [Chryseobacterium sp. CY353]MCY0968359.1 HpaII family restriction endonuclease [Chryseobacterium sp. CY353]